MRAVSQDGVTASTVLSGNRSARNSSSGRFSEENRESETMRWRESFWTRI